MKFCGQCTAPLARICPKCHFENPPGFKFCGQCTVALGPATAKPEPSRPSLRIRESDDAAAIEGERKTVTALFADIKGSTELEQDLDPEEARAIVDPALRLMIDAVRRYDGYIVQSTGDGIFALFGAPVAHEDHPQRALYAALRMQEEIRRYAERLRADGRAPIQIRVGVNTGEVVVRTIATGDGHVEYTPIGHTTNLASRMQTLADPGATVISESTRKLVEGYLALKPLGPARIKGITEPVNVYEVTGLGPLRTRLQRSAGRGLTKFVGREREIETLKHAAGLAREGRGQIAAAVAEAGTGKSRLFFEFKAITQSGWMVLEAFSVSHGKASAYLPVIDLMHSYFGIDSADDARRRRERVAGKIVILDRSLEDTLPYLYSLLAIAEADDPLSDMDAQVRRRRTLDAIKRILLRESLNQPLMVVFEDLHWIDSETQAFLNLLADSIGTAKILLLVDYRPEYSHQWNSKTYYTQLRLDPLGRESAKEMLSSLIGDGEDLVPLKRLVIERTEGNPFFMEEIVQALFEEGALARNGPVKLARSLREIRVPTTVQAVLASRIDRLPPDEKELLQTLAVIGREFSVALARQVAGRPAEELDRMMEHLQFAEFIYEQPGVGEIEYIFKHALTQEVAYNSVLIERRKLLHERIAITIEELFAAQIEDHLGELARHYARSANARKSVDYALLAGRQAAQRSAYAEAIAYLNAGLESLSTLPGGLDRDRLELDLQIASGGVLGAAKGYASGDVERAYLRARKLCARAGTSEQLFRVLDGLRWFYSWKGDLESGLKLDEEMLELAVRRQDPVSEAIALVDRGIDRYVVGEFASARDDLERVLILPDAPLRSLDAPYSSSPSVIALSFLSWIRWTLGYPCEALKTSEMALSAARQQSRPLPLVVALYFAGELHWFLRDPHSARHYAEEALSLSGRQGYGLELARSTILRGWALVAQGNPEAGLAETFAGLAAYDATGASMFESAAMAADACLIAGRTNQGLEIVARAFKLGWGSGDHFFAEPLHRRLKGELLLRRDPSAAPEAERCFREAIAVASRQKAKSWELGATISLARLLRGTNRRDEARTMLAEIYNWFTEGFDTADLKEAKVLLEELNA